MRTERVIHQPPTNSFDVAELALIEMSRLQRRIWNDRWENILIDAGEPELAASMAAEYRSPIIGAQP